MKATVQFVKQKFEEFNQLCFAGKLPELPIVLSDAKGFLGKCCYKVRKNADGTSESYGFYLSINTRIDFPQQVVEDTIIHEMIHYFIGYNKLEDVSSHGPMFQHIMNSINEKYGRHISVSHQYTEEEREQAHDKRQLWHVVAVVKLTDGTIGIKVVPRIVSRILSFRKGVIDSGRLETIDFYLSNDPFFNRFPNSASLRINPLTMDEINKHITSAKHLTVTDKQVIIPQ